MFLENIEDILRTSLGEIKSSSLIDSNFFMPLVRVCKLKPQLERAHLHARTQEKSVLLILNCLQATLITSAIMMFPASCLDTQRMGM